MPDREEIERWLFSEETGDDDTADAAFAQLFSALPKVEPGPTFIARTVAAVESRRVERRRRAARAWAAALAVAVAGSVVAYVAMPYIGPWAIKAVAIATGRSVPWLISFTTVALDWWWGVGRVGSSLATAIATPERATALIGVELVGILAFFALQKLARGGRLGEART